MTEFRSPASEDRRRPRWGVAAVVALLHVILGVALVRAFTPDLAASVVRSVTTAFDIPVAPPSPPPPPPPPPAPASSPAAAQGAQGAAGKHARPRPVAAPSARVVVKPTQAPPVAGTGRENAAGAASAGAAAGASGSGAGSGSGASGSGQGAGGDGTGGGRAAPTVKIAGDINSARDYPRGSREKRLGQSVTIELAIDREGRVSSCRVVQASPDATADRITCDLAKKRFRFRPALDRAGTPIPAVYRWRQRWFT